MEKSKPHVYTMLATDVKQRLDQVAVRVYPQHSRSFLATLISEGGIKVNDKLEKPSYRVRLGDVMTLQVLPLTSLTLIPEPIPLDIIFEDDDLLIINKQQGMVVHPSAGHTSGTLVHALLHHCKDLSGIHGTLRPGIVHRIDKDTSGLIIVAKHDQSHQFLAAQLKDHSLSRVYLALVTGVMKENSGTIIAPIGRDRDDRLAMHIDGQGKAATTYFKVVERLKQHTLISCSLKTGRTHQIRVHMQYIHHPIESDLRYGHQRHPLHPHGQLLHAHQLSFCHPKTKKMMTFSSPLPDYFQAILTQLRG
jgi:23S rRNA pseudouridine1911/1915/1917 synthase